MLKRPYKLYLSAVLCGTLTLSIIHLPHGAAASVKRGAACKKLNAIQKVGKVEYKCVKVGKKLTWQVNKSQTPTPTPSSTSQNKTPTIGWICDGLKDLGGFKDGSGVDVVCIKGGDGVYAWRPKSEFESSPTPSPTPTPSSSTSGTLLPPSPTPSPSPAKQKIALDTFEVIPASTIVEGGKIGAPCDIEGTRSYPGVLWEILVCAPKPNTKELVWHNNYTAFMYAGLETGGVLPSEPCVKDGETRGVPQGTLLCTMSTVRNRLE